MVQKYINVHFLDFQTLSSLDSDMMHDHISSNESILFLCLFSWRICVGCQAEIGHGRFLSCMGGVWHPECFCCNACDKPIIDYEVPIHFIKYYYCILLILLKLNLFKLCFTVLNVRKSALSQIMLQGAASS